MTPEQDWNSTLGMILGLWPEFAKTATDEQKAAWRHQFRDRNQVWLCEAVQMAWARTKWKNPNPADVESAWREVRAGKSDGAGHTGRERGYVGERHETAAVWMREWIRRGPPAPMVQAWATKNAWRFTGKRVPDDIDEWEYRQLADAVVEMRRDLEVME